MPNGEILTNITDILTHYGFPFNREDLAQDLAPSPSVPGHNLRNIVTTTGSITGSYVVILAEECSFGPTHNSEQYCFPRFFSEAAYQFTIIRAGREISYSPVLYFNPLDPLHLEAALNPQSKLLHVRGGVGFDWTDIALHGHLHTLGKSLNLGDHIILADCGRRGHVLPAAKKDNKTTPDTRTPQREYKYGYDVYFTIHSTEGEHTWYGHRERIRSDITNRCNADDNTTWTNEGGHHNNILGVCPAIWKCTSQLTFEIYSTVYDFKSDSFLSTYCYPHPTRGDDKTVTILTITQVTPHDSTQLHLLHSLSAPTVEDVLESFSEQYTIADIDIMYAIYPANKFSPSRCLYGNPDIPANTKHRYVVLWKDGVERQLPDKIRTREALYTLQASADGQHHLPGFWTTEHSTTRSKYYNGLLRTLYAQYTAHSRLTQHKSSLTVLRGLRPSPRWYQYEKNRDLSEDRTSITPGGRTPGGGGPRNPPGRGHPHLPRPWGPPQALPNTPEPNTDSDNQVITVRGMQQLFQQLVNMGQEQRTETTALARQLREDNTTQARINADLQNSLAQLSADLAALRHTPHND